MNGESAISFKELFSKDIDRNINGVIKANDEKNLDDEVNEYVLTEEICRNLAKFLDAYNDPSNHEQNGAWISGFFGSSGAGVSGTSLIVTVCPLSVMSLCSVTFTGSSGLVMS